MAAGVGWHRVAEQIRPRLKERRIPTTLVIAAFILFPFLFGLHGLYTNPLTFRDDYRGIVELIGQDGRESAAVILNAPNQWEVFTWYVGDASRQTLYPMPKSRRPDDQIQQEVESVLAEHDFVYALFWGYEGFDPNRVVESTLDRQAFKSTDEWYGDVRLVTYGVLGDFLPDENNQPDLEVDGEFLLPDGVTKSGVQLNWVEINDEVFRSGDVIGLAFEWEAEREIDGQLATGPPNTDHWLLATNYSWLVHPLCLSGRDCGAGIDCFGVGRATACVCFARNVE